jgi:hypothetical protein
MARTAAKKKAGKTTRRRRELSQQARELRRQQRAQQGNDAFISFVRPVVEDVLGSIIEREQKAAAEREERLRGSVERLSSIDPPAGVAFAGAGPMRGDLGKSSEQRSNVQTHLDDLSRAMAHLDDVTARLPMRLEPVLSSNTPAPPAPSLLGDVGPVAPVGCEVSSRIRSVVAQIDDIRSRVQDVLSRVQV